MTLLLVAVSAHAVDPDCAFEGSTLVPVLVPTDDDAYNRYIQEIDDFVRSLEDPDVAYQVGPGMAGIFQPPPTGGPAVQTGSVWAKETDNPFFFIEDWFVDVPMSQYDGSGRFSLTYLDEVVLDQAQVPYWQTGTWLHMQIHQKKPPTPIPPGFLEYEFGNAPGARPSELSAWAFDLLQGGEIRGWLLRVQHPDDVWMDFWMMKGSYSFVDDPGETVAALRRTVIPTSTAEFVNSTSGYAWFAVVPYLVQKSCTFPPFNP